MACTIDSCMEGLTLSRVLFPMSYVLNSPTSTLTLVSKAEVWGFLSPAYAVAGSMPDLGVGA